MRMSARVDGVASRVQSAIQMRQVQYGFVSYRLAVFHTEGVERGDVPV